MMFKDIQGFINEVFRTQPESYEERRDKLPTTILFATLFFLPYYFVLQAPRYGFDSVQFKVDFFCGHYVLAGFALAFLLSKKYKNDLVLALPAFGAFAASMHFLIHPEFNALRPYVWNYAQLCALIFAASLATLRCNAILFLLNLFVPLFLGIFLDHITLYEIIERQAIVYFIGVLIMYYLYKVQVNHRELRIKSEQAELIKFASELGTWQWNLKTNYVIYDKRWKEILGYDEKELKGHVETWETLIHPEDLEPARQAFGEYLQGTSPHYEVKFRMKHKSGKWVPIISKGKIIEYDLNGEPLVFSGTHFDFTILEELEENLQNEKLKLIHSAKLATLGQMAAGVAHEINNPLAIISNSNSLLQKVDRPGIKEEVTQNIEESVDRIVKIVKGLRKFCRDTSEFNRSETSVESIIKESLDLVSHKARNESVEIITKNLANHKVYCDELEIEQILVNLLNNAIDANAENEKAWIDISTEEFDETIAIVVKDSGKGIDESVLKNLFDPFFTTKDVNEGTGLGLSISRSIAEEHRGSLNYQLRDGHTAFILELPRN